MALVDASTGELVGRQVMPELDDEIRRALRDSIERFGVLVPIVVDQHGEIIDGHNRWDLAHELDVTCPSIAVTVETEADALDVARTLNLDRRHMPKSTRAQLAQSLRNRGHSLRAIAGALGVSHEQARQDSGDDDEVATVKGVDSGKPDKVVGLDGREQPATRRGPWSPDELLQLLDRVDAGESRDDLAEEHGISRSNLGSLLSRARKLRKGESPTEKLARVNERVRAEEIQKLAAENLTSPQIAKRLGIGEQQVRNIAKRNGIDITADAVVGRAHRIVPARVVEQTVLDLAANASALEELPIDFDGLDPAQCAEWATSVSSSLLVLKRFHKRLKEMAR